MKDRTSVFYSPLTLRIIVKEWRWSLSVLVQLAKDFTSKYLVLRSQDYLRYLRYLSVYSHTERSCSSEKPMGYD